MASEHVEAVSKSTLPKAETPVRNELDDGIEDWFIQVLDLIAQIVTRIPEATVSNPDLAAEFIKQLGGVEDSDGVDSGNYRAAYAASLQQAQQAVRLGKPLTTHLFLHPGDIEGVHSPKLYYELNSLLPEGAPRTQDWPQDARNRNYRLNMVQAGLSIQGVIVLFGHGKDKGSLSVTITDNLNPKPADQGGI
jgi:hypothetical protein